MAHAAFAHEDWQEAERRFDDILTSLPNTDEAPEALYWRGVARYKYTHEAAALQDTEAAFRTRYTSSVWAKKASVWG